MAGAKKTFLIVFGVLLVLALAGYLAWDTFYGPRAMRLAGDKLLRENYETYQRFVRRYEEAMRADTYGGKTPEETLRLFTEALERNDLALAAKYFMLETNESDPDYLTRKKWEEAIKKFSDENLRKNLLENLSKVEPTRDQSRGDPTTFWFSVYEKDEAQYHILMGFNEHSGVWKIESM
jgi:uncharacterized membrane protein